MALKDEYFTISEAAKDIGVTRQTISRWITERDIPVEKIGRVTLIKKEDLKYQRIRLSFAAADRIIALIYRGYTDYCKEKGYITAIESVTCVNVNARTAYSNVSVATVGSFDGSSRKIKISAEQNAEILSRVEKGLVEFLFEFDRNIKKRFQQFTISKTKSKRGGKKSK